MLYWPLITNTIGMQTQISTCRGIRGFLSRIKCLPATANADTHIYAHAHTNTALAKPPLARSEQWEQMSHDCSVDPVFVRERERERDCAPHCALQCVGPQVCVVVCHILMRTLLNPTASVNISHTDHHQPIMSAHFRSQYRKEEMNKCKNKNVVRAQSRTVGGKSLKVPLK